MNERIRELANKAVGKRSCYMIEAEYIKFAELLVSECADIANQQFKAATGLDDRDCWTAAEMKQRFGVTE